MLLETIMFARLAAFEQWEENWKIQLMDCMNVDHVLTYVHLTDH